ncbi:MAG: C40 family peptidase [Flavobacteriales bacterium]|jgi:gamma-D-glutamyl-L-lysine dipeptidyl-peptidase|nr:C40 family peptidase [Flavobacteriales bacterium]MDP4818780.1 C40 family peptidase [Flavobacteriales bacterium]MDP4951300.1 C40 family peptidase [Flavobacteriales bacterium]MDP5075601.1 C40 family peptidase [Flavobacteriales bacterium]
MVNGQCLLSFIPMRAESSDRSEQVSQLIFGETYEVLEENEKWYFIEASFDQYRGWIDKKQFSPQVFEVDTHRVFAFPSALQAFENKYILMPLGAFVPEDFQNQLLTLNEALALFKTYIGVPYVWGGKTNFGYDCSGFTQSFFKTLRISLKRDAYQQATEGTDVMLLSEAKTGDLAFFDNADGRITHVGIILENNGTFEILHASGELRIDILDHQGINKKSEGYSHNLRLIRRIL